MTICEQDDDVTMFLKFLRSNPLLYETHAFLKSLDGGFHIRSGISAFKSDTQKQFNVTSRSSFVFKTMSSKSLCFTHHLL